MYAADVLHAGPTGRGWLRTAPGIGAAVCGAVLGSRPSRGTSAAGMFAGSVVVYGCATLLFATSTLFWLSMAALVVMRLKGDAFGFLGSDLRRLRKRHRDGYFTLIPPRRRTRSVKVATSRQDA